jgi:hypothetical protein
MIRQRSGKELVSTRDLREAAAFLRGNDTGADVRVLNRVAEWIDKELAKRKLRGETEAAGRGKKKEAKQDGISQ